ncbi:uncharacterized protein [Macrobrachium rosenbergii]|uniref:uncharacterized protein isoform X2 n=1 Tax=Macrobrachium rosenbergii TaxID=79674 RepID=UPI0034D76F98
MAAFRRWGLDSQSSELSVGDGNVCRVDVGRERERESESETPKMSKDTGSPPLDFYDVMEDQQLDDFITIYTESPLAVEPGLTADDISLIGSRESHTMRSYSQSNWTSTATPRYPRSPESNAQNTEMSYRPYTPGNNPAGERAIFGQRAESGGRGFAESFGYGGDCHIGHNPQNQQATSHPRETGRRQRREERHQTTGGYGGHQGEGPRRHPPSFPGDGGMDERRSFR